MPGGLHFVPATWLCWNVYRLDSQCFNDLEKSLGLSPCVWERPSIILTPLSKNDAEGRKCSLSTHTTHCRLKGRKQSNNEHWKTFALTLLPSRVCVRKHSYRHACTHTQQAKQWWWRIRKKTNTNTNMVLRAHETDSIISSAVISLQVIRKHNFCYQFPVLANYLLVWLK